MKTYSHVSVIMISRNEEQSVRKVIEGIRQKVPGAEILLVDSSTDHTAEIAESLGARVIKQIPARGYGPAMKVAMLTPTRDIIVTLDCDNTYPIETIPTLIAKIEEGYDVVGTSRLSRGKPQHMPWMNYVANEFFNLLASAVFLRRIHDSQTGMRAYRRGVLHKITFWWEGRTIPGMPMHFGAKGNSLPVELFLKPMSLGYRCVEIPIRYDQRFGETKLDRLNSAQWAAIRIFTSRFANRRIALTWIVIIAIAFFHIHNLTVYSPHWGYDSVAHTQYMRYIAEERRLPATGMDTSLVDNPPLYYIVGALILKLFGNFKWVQFFSFGMYLLDVVLLYRLIRQAPAHRYLKTAVPIFFALLPISLNFGYMLLNYSLAFFLSIVMLYLMLQEVQRKQLNRNEVILLALLASAGMLTALVAFSTLVLLLIFLLFFPYVHWKKRLAWFAMVVLLVSVTLAPYYQYRLTTVYDCFFCTTHRSKTATVLWQTYPLKFYHGFPFQALREPFMPNHATEGLPLLLHQTLFGDYFDYLVSRRLSYEIPPIKDDYIHTGAHFIDAQKIRRLTWLNYIGIPIALLLIGSLIRGVLDAMRYLWKRRPEHLPAFLLTTGILLASAQFMIYILQYPNYVNIHAGYLFSAVFMLCALLTYQIRRKWTAAIVSIVLLLHSVSSYYTFFLI